MEKRVTGRFWRLEIMAKIKSFLILVSLVSLFCFIDTSAEPDPGFQGEVKKQGPVSDAPVDINVTVDKKTITIGDRITYRVEVIYDDGIEIEPLVIAENLSEFEIKDYTIEEPEKDKNGRWLSRMSYIITTFTTGEFTIPPVVVKYKDRQGASHKISSDRIKITVEKVKRKPGDKNDIRPLKGVVGIKEKPAVWPFIIFILLLIAGILIFTHYLRKKHIQDLPPVPPRPPYEIATEALNALQTEGLIEKGMIKEYYIRLADIIRSYLEARYNIFALDRTTWELYQDMKSKKIERRYIERIKAFLEDCDLVKFAKYIPVQKEIHEAYSRAREIIEMTKPESVDSKSGSHNSKEQTQNPKS